MGQSSEGAILGMMAELRIALDLVQARAAELIAENEQLRGELAAKEAQPEQST